LTQDYKSKVVPYLSLTGLNRSTASSTRPSISGTDHLLVV